jgi:hypothetical protein
MGKPQMSKIKTEGNKVRQFIFYALISETKEKAKDKDKPKTKSKDPLTMKGPFIHIKPQEISNNEVARHVFTDPEEIKKEKKYLTKKFHNEIPIFILIKVERPSFLNDEEFENEKDDAALKAYGLFNKQFDLMKENYQICTRM